MCSTKVVLMLEPKKCVVHADAASQLQRPQQLLASRRFELSSYFERVRGHFSPLSQLTPRLTGAGARSAEGTNTGHQNGEAMASVGVRVEPTVRLGHEALAIYPATQRML